MDESPDNKQSPSGTFWRRIYALMVFALAVYVLAFYLLTNYFS